MMLALVGCQADESKAPPQCNVLPPAVVEMDWAAAEVSAYYWDHHPNSYDFVVGVESPPIAMSLVFTIEPGDIDDHDGLFPTASLSSSLSCSEFLSLFAYQPNPDTVYGAYKWKPMTDPAALFAVRTVETNEDGSCCQLIAGELGPFELVRDESQDFQKPEDPCLYPDAVEMKAFEFSLHNVESPGPLDECNDGRDE